LAMAAAAGLAGVVAMVVGGYLRSHAEKKKKQTMMIMHTPRSNVRDVWVKMEQLEMEEEHVRGRKRHDLMKPMEYVKVVGETWARPNEAVPDRFGKMHVAILDEIVEVCQKVRCEGKNVYSVDNMNCGKCSWYQDETVLSKKRRGGDLYLRDPSMAAQNSRRELQALEHDIVERSTIQLQGKVEACREILKALNRKVRNTALAVRSNQT